MATNTIPLTRETADQLKSMYGKARASTSELSRFAARIRNENLNPDGNSYSGDFNRFWKANELSDVFKSLSNFTKYAGAGDVIEKFETTYPDKVKNLPDAVSTLYEISLLRNDELRLCIEDTYSRSEVTPDEKKWKKPKRAVPLINPEVRSRDISFWKKRWREPTQRSTDTRRISLIEIKIDASLFKFKKGEHAGSVSFNEVERLVEELKKATENINSSNFLVKLHADKLRETYAAKANKSADDAAKPKKKSSRKKA
jgi:hypothetical protein